MIRALALALLLPAAAAAQSPVNLPAGCEAYVTIQKRSCVVTHNFTCDGDPAGHQRRVDYTEEGMIYMGRIDAETQWIESFHIRADVIERLAPDPADPASLTDLLQTGRDTWDFQTVSEPPAITVYRGHDELTGNQIVIDGVTLEETVFDVIASDPSGAELWRVTGSEFVHRDWRIFLSGVRVVTTPSEQFETDGRPVEFIFPGEPGFLSATPRHDCGNVMSKGQ